jgi:hypothetical protein
MWLLTGLLQCMKCNKQQTCVSTSRLHHLSTVLAVTKTSQHFKGPADLFFNFQTHINVYLHVLLKKIYFLGNSYGTHFQFLPIKQIKCQSNEPQCEDALGHAPLNIVCFCASHIITWNQRLLYNETYIMLSFTAMHKALIYYGVELNMTWSCNTKYIDHITVPHPSSFHTGTNGNISREKHDTHLV